MKSACVIFLCFGDFWKNVAVRYSLNTAMIMLLVKLIGLKVWLKSCLILVIRYIWCVCVRACVCFLMSRQKERERERERESARERERERERL